MLFTSVEYMIFLPMVFVLYWTFNHRFRWFILLIASYYFYMSFNPKLIVLILFTTLISYFGAIKIEKSKNEFQKKFWLILSIVICLGLLLYFKYFIFFITSITDLLNYFTIPLHLNALKIILPIGISFYTFQILGYLIDVYRESEKAERHFGKYALFVSYFPKLLLGPIERTNTLLPQIHKKQTFNYNDTVYGLKLIAWGVFKKIAIANSIASYVNLTYNNLEASSGFSILIAIFCFAIQLYCDFSGYIDIAAGSSKLLGINLSKNFDSPYFAKSISDFWRRWHITLSCWFKDYLFYPIMRTNFCTELGKFSKKIFPKYYAQNIPVIIALILVWSLIGLWHGASWNYILYGLYHGILIILGILITPLDKYIINKFKININSAFYNFFKILITFVLVCFGYILFRANNLSDVSYIINQIFRQNLQINFQYSIKHLTQLLLIVSVGILFIYDYLSLKVNVMEKIKHLNFISRWFLYYLIVGITIYIALFTNLPTTDFIYFHF